MTVDATGPVPDTGSEQETSCGYCGRDPALGNETINGRPFCHWSPSMGATCYTAQVALNAVEARRAAGEPPSVRDLLGILATLPDDGPCERCGNAAHEWCETGLHLYCGIHVGRGCLDPCEGCAEDAA